MLPGIGFQELFFIAIVALVVVGPKDLPLMLRKLGQIVAKGRALAGEFRAAFDDIARQAELDELRKEIEDLKNLKGVQAAAEDLRDYEREMNDSVMRGQTDQMKAGEMPVPETPAKEEPAKTPDTRPAETSK